VSFASGDWWYHPHAHADFQVMIETSRQAKVLIVNSLGMRMPMPGKTDAIGRRVLRKVRSTAHLLKRPRADLPNLAVLSPVFLPMYGGGAAARANATFVAAQVRLACKHLGIHRPHCLVAVPTALPVVQRLDVADMTYLRVDRQSAVSDVDHHVIGALEDELFRTADHVLYSNRGLLEEERVRHRGEAIELPHGVDTTLFDPARHVVEPADLSRIPRPRLIIIGALDGPYRNIDLLVHVAREVTEASLVIVGARVTDARELAGRPNVHLLGSRPHDAIPAYLAHSDVGLIAIPEDEWGRLSSPIKLREYLAMGMPVVTNTFAGVESYADVLRIASTPEEYVGAVRSTLGDGGPASAAERRAKVQDVTWEQQAARYRELVGER
jgi:glycosyltransferase involved in cell wall biosynthesis